MFWQYGKLEISTYTIQPTNSISLIIDRRHGHYMNFATNFHWKRKQHYISNLLNKSWNSQPHIYNIGYKKATNISTNK